MNQFQKAQNIIFVLLFWILTMVNFWAPLMGVEDAEKNELRELSPKPSLSWNSDAHTFPAQYEKYFSDTFSMRYQLIKIDRRIRVELLRERYIGWVVIGDDNWLFLNNRGNTRDCQKVELFSENGLSRYLRTLDLIASDLNAQGIELYFAIIPGKCTVYSEKIVDYLPVLGAESRLEQYTAFMEANSDLQFIDLKTDLIRFKNEQQLYYKLDPHWTDHGNYLGYRAIVKSIFPEIPENEIVQLSQFKEIKIIPDKDRTILGIFLSNSEIYSEEIPELIFEHGINSSITEDRIFVYNNPDSQNNLTAVIFHDSFFGHDIGKTLLAQHFKTTIFYFENSGHAWEPDKEFLSPIIDRWNPDIIIVERAERFIEEIGTIPK